MGTAPLEQAIAITPRDPRNALFVTHLAMAYLATGELDKGLAFARDGAQRESELLEPGVTLAAILAHLGRPAEARSALDKTGLKTVSSVASRPWWRRYRTATIQSRVLEGLRKLGLPE